MFIPNLSAPSDIIVLRRTEVGQEAEDIVAQGGLLPDKMVLKVVTSKLDKLHNKVRIRYSFIACFVNLLCYTALDIGRFPSHTRARRTSG